MATVLTTATAAALLSPAMALAQGGTDSPPADGGDTGPILLGVLVIALVLLALFALTRAHRKQKTAVLENIGNAAGRSTGLPSWAALPVVIASVSLLVALLGIYWDMAIHVDEGRDEGPFANAPHFLIVAGLFGVTAAGLLAMALPRHKPSPTARALPRDRQVPLGGFLMFVCAGVALFSFLMDDVWHRIFGHDVTLWGPVHLLLLGATALATLGTWILFVEGKRSAEFNEFPPKARFHQFQTIALAGAFLLALSTFQGEFDYGVPQVRLDWHPILLMMAAGIALVAARIVGGKGAALGAVVFFLVIRVLLALWVDPITGHTTLHFPLYLVEALVVEAVALAVARDKPIRLGIYAGIGIGTLGLAAEWAWSHVWWDLPWTSSMLPEAAILGFLSAVAGGIIGGFIGRSLASPWVSPVSRPKWLVPAAAAVAVGVFIYATPTGEAEEPTRATIALTDAAPPPERTVNAQVRLDPPNAAEGARWLTLTGWQGGGSHVDRLKEVAPGVYESTKPLPVHGNWKSTLRLHKDDVVLGVPVYLPADPAIPADPVAARATFTSEFQQDEELLQREQKPDVSTGLSAFAHVVVLAIALGLILMLARGLRRFDKVHQQLRLAGDSVAHETKVGSRGVRDGDGDSRKVGERAASTRSKSD